jgi:hypothetical protein
MNRSMSKSELSVARRRLVELMQRINFGRIENLVVRGGEPVLEPLPRVVRELKIGGDNNPRPESRREDFLIKSHLTELFAHLADVGDGTVEALDIKHGLPFRLLIARAPA